MLRAGIADAVAVGILLVRVGFRWAVVADIAQTVADAIALRHVGRLGAVVADVTEALPIGVHQVVAGDQRAGGIRDRQSVIVRIRVTGIADAITVHMALIEVTRRGAVVADATFTYKSHSTSHRVALESARLDLLGLEERGLLTKRRVGLRMVFRPVENLAELLADGEHELQPDRG